MPLQGNKSEPPGVSWLLLSVIRSCGSDMQLKSRASLEPHVSIAPQTSQTVLLELCKVPIIPGHPVRRIHVKVSVQFQVLKVLLEVSGSLLQTYKFYHLAPNRR